MQLLLSMLLVGAPLAIGVIAVGGCEEEVGAGKLPPGRWSRGPESRPQDPKLREEIARLEAIGYVDAAEPAPARHGVVHWDRERAYPGMNLYVSGHAPEALLMDMSGGVRHRWSVGFDEAFDGEKDFGPGAAPGYTFSADLHNFRRARLLPGGELLAIFEGFGIVKLDRASRLIWSRPNRAHHDIDVDDEGRIWVLTRKAVLEPRINRKKPVLLDSITVLGADGSRIRDISIHEAFMRSDFRARMRRVRFLPQKTYLTPQGDFMHTNSLQLLDGRLAARSPAFREGNVLISLREPSLLAVVDPRSEKVVWCASGFWSAQHDPTVTEDGQMLLFDNLGGLRGLESSRVVAFDPFTLEIFWRYTGSADRALHSPIMGTAARLPNGNTLITETQQGRVIEVTGKGEIVWEFVNPHRGGEAGELIAVIAELVRLGSDVSLDWLEPD